MRRYALPALLWSAAASSLVANPTGGVVANGAATFSGLGTSSVTINQGSDRAVINWQTFSIGSGELTKFVQPSSGSAALNRVLGGQTSFINGTLSANGQVFLINGNGVVVGPSGLVSTAGFTASTRDIADTDFMSGHLHFVGDSDGGVRNLGTISALGGDVVLIGKTVENVGTINATGTAALVAGEDVLLAQKNADGSTVTVNPVASPGAPTRRVGVKNTGVIQASRAELKAANGNIYALAIQNEGLVQATTVTQQGGHIYLTSDTGTIENSGTLDASATAAGGAGGSILLKSTAGKVVHSGKLLARGGAGGAGGTADVSGAVVDFTGAVDLRAAGGTTGNLLIDPANLTVNTTGLGTVSGGQNDSTSSFISNATVDNALENADLTLNADSTITVNAEIQWDTTSKLTFSTNGPGTTSVQIDAPIVGESGSLAFYLNSNSDVVGTSLGGTVQVANFYLKQGTWRQLVNDGSGNGGNLPQTIVAGSPQDILPTFQVTGDFELGSGTTFLRADSGNGTTVYYGLEDIFGVQGMNSASLLSSNFTLNGRSIDGTVTQFWNPQTSDGGPTTYAGFVPIGFGSENSFSGSLVNGTIGSVTINQPGANGVGLFTTIGTNGVVSNVQLDSFTVTGQDSVGALAGSSYGQIDGVSLYNGTITGNNTVGGLVGYLAGGNVGESGPAVHLNSSGVNYSTVSGQMDVGGLVGDNAGQIDGVEVSDTTVTGNTNVGGVAGINESNSNNESYITPGNITYTTFSGTVTNTDSNGESSNLGGIAGENDGSITYSNTYPGATVTGDEDVGGIAGLNTGTIDDSYNSASVTGASNDYEVGDIYIGGIAGENGGANPVNFNNDFVTADVTVGITYQNYGLIENSYNTGAVSGGTYVGGIVGQNDYSANIVRDVYNVGTVSGGDHVGGIVGDNAGTVQYVYNSGGVSGSSATIGALVGYNESGATVSNGYWDTSTSTQTVYLNGDTTNVSEIGTVSTSDGTAYSALQEEDAPGSGYSYFGNATTENSSGNGLFNNGVYQIGTSPDGGPAWYILPGQTRPLLAMEFTGNIENPHELQLIATDLGGNFYIGQPLDLIVVTNLSEVWAAAGFAPLGSKGEGQNAFTGLLNGNGETLSNLYINQSSQADVGLFGAVASSATVTNFTVNDPSVTGGSTVGAVAGENDGQISSVNITYDGGGTGIAGTSQVGGLAGLNLGMITLAENQAPVSGNNEVGGIVGQNDQDPGTVSQSYNTGTITGTGANPTQIGGIAGVNDNLITQCYNVGNIGGATVTEVGGLAGQNNGQIDDSYGGGGADMGTITGAAMVGGLVGDNEGTLETSYSTSPVSVANSLNDAGYLVGYNNGTVSASYWDSDYTHGENSNVSGAIGANSDAASVIGVVGYSQSNGQLRDARRYAQGDAPTLWNFNPQGTADPGPWGINVYNSYNQSEGNPSGLVNDGLPVLQWQTPVNVEVAASNGSQYYGYTPGYTATGSGTSQLSTALPNGVTVATSGGNQAGDVNQIAVSGTPSVNAGDFSIEYVNGTVGITPAPLTIVANSYTIPVDGMLPAQYGAVYNGLQNGDTPGSLDGTLAFTGPASGATSLAGFYQLLVNGQSSSNYSITFVPGTINVFAPMTPSQPPTPGFLHQQQVQTQVAEVNTIQNFFANDPTSGLNPVFFLTLPDVIGLDSDDGSPVNGPTHDHDYAHGSGSGGLPYFSHLVVPGTGVVEIIDGAIVVGNPLSGAPIYLTNPGNFLPPDVVANLRDVLSPASYNQLFSLTHGY